MMGLNTTFAHLVLLFYMCTSKLKLPLHKTVCNLKDGGGKCVWEQGARGGGRSEQGVGAMSKGAGEGSKGGYYIETAPLHLRAIGQLLKELLHFRELGIPKVSSRMPSCRLSTHDKFSYAASDTSPHVKILKQSDNYSSLKVAKYIVLQLIIIGGKHDWMNDIAVWSGRLGPV